MLHGGHSSSAELLGYTAATKDEVTGPGGAHYHGLLRRPLLMQVVLADALRNLLPQPAGYRVAVLRTAGLPLWVVETERSPRIY